MARRRPRTGSRQRGICPRRTGSEIRSPERRIRCAGMPVRRSGRTPLHSGMACRRTGREIRCTGTRHREQDHDPLHGI